MAIKVWEKVVADHGYQGDVCVVIPDYARDEVHEEEMNIARARHETVNGLTQKLEEHVYPLLTLKGQA